MWSLATTTTRRSSRIRTIAKKRCETAEMRKCVPEPVSAEISVTRLSFTLSTIRSLDLRTGRVRSPGRTLSPGIATDRSQSSRTFLPPQNATNTRKKIHEQGEPQSLQPLSGSLKTQNLKKLSGKSNRERAPGRKVHHRNKLLELRRGRGCTGHGNR